MKYKLTFEATTESWDRAAEIMEALTPFPEVEGTIAYDTQGPTTSNAGAVASPAATA